MSLPTSFVQRPPTVADQWRRRDLVRMKGLALAFLLGAAVVYLVAARWEEAGAPGWLGFVRAAAEAGMVGGLADWFAVTALFRRPLGLPIPHTAIIPTRKDALGRNLGDFVGANFLSDAVVRERLRRADVAGRVGTWLSAHEHAERVTAELVIAVRAATETIRDDDVREVLERAIFQRLADFPAGPPLGRLLARVVEDGGHRGFVDVAVEHVYRWVLANRPLIVDVVSRQAPAWSPRFLDEQVAGLVYAELRRVVSDVRADPDHGFRKAADRYLAGLADDLRVDIAMGQRVDEAKRALLDSPDVRRAFRDVLASGRRLLFELLDDPHSELRARFADGLASLGRRLVEDEGLRARANDMVERAVVHIVTNYRDELTRVITDTVERWDAREVTEKMELQVGRDLQFIRINGTVVGALAGLVIHAASVLLV